MDKLMKPLKSNKEFLPSEANNIIGPHGINIKDIDICGTIIWACPGNTVPSTIFKSTNIGSTWKTLHIDPSAGINADLVAVAPDNHNYVAICDTKALLVYFTSNSGETWVNLGTPKTLNIINDIDISPNINGINFVVISGQDSNNKGNTWSFGVGSISPAWKEINKKYDKGHITETITSHLAVEFSPNFFADSMMLVVTLENANIIKLHAYNFNTNTWDSPTYKNYPIELIDNDKPITETTRVSKVLDPNFYGGDEAAQIAFIGIDTGGSNVDGIYRLYPGKATQILSNNRIFSIAWDGTNLIAGQTDKTYILRSHNALGNSPIFLSTSTFKNPGGTEKSIVAFISGIAVACTSGVNSAFAVSSTFGASFNDISLINTEFTNIEDVDISSDKKTVYLVTDDTKNTSIWRSNNGVWNRILSLAGVHNLLIRAAPDNPDFVYLISTTNTEMYFSRDGGLERWVPRALMEVADDFIVKENYFACLRTKTGKFFKTTNSGFSWINDIAPENLFVSRLKDKLASINPALSFGHVIPLKPTITLEKAKALLPKKKFFISYCDEDGLGLASGAAKILEANGYQSWYFDKNKSPSVYVHDDITFQITDSCHIIIYICTKNSIDSTGQNYEVGQGIYIGKQIIIIRIDGSIIPKNIQSINYIPMKSGSFQSEFNTFVRDQLENTIKIWTEIYKNPKSI
jgi:hypothetical protein